MTCFQINCAIKPVAQNTAARAKNLQNCTVNDGICGTAFPKEHTHVQKCSLAGACWVTVKNTGKNKLFSYNAVMFPRASFSFIVAYIEHNWQDDLGKTTWLERHHSRSWCETIKVGNVNSSVFIFIYSYKPGEITLAELAVSHSKRWASCPVWFFAPTAKCCEGSHHGPC